MSHLVLVLVLERQCSSQHFELPTYPIFATRPRSFTIVHPHRRLFEDDDEDDDENEMGLKRPILPDAPHWSVPKSMMSPIH